MFGGEDNPNNEHDRSRGSGLRGRHAGIIAFAAVAALVPALIGTGSSERFQVAHSAWTEPAVWSTDAGDTLAHLTQGEIDLMTVESEEATPTPEPAPQPEPEPDPTPVPTPTPEPWAVMEVRPGDTLSDLAYWFGVKPGDIAWANGMGVGDYVVVGESIVIPIPQSNFVEPPQPAVVFAVEEETPAAPAGGGAVAPPPTEAPPPAPTPPPAPQPAPFTGTSDEVTEAICSLPWPCEKMVAIAMCESGLVPTAYNPAGYYGLFQINYQFDGWDDPWVNAQVAYEQKYLPDLQHGGDGLGPWPICKSY